MKLLKENIKFIIFLAIIGVFAGVLMGDYTLSILPEDQLALLAQELGDIKLYSVVAVVQVLGYAIGLGIPGIYLANKVGLWKEFKFERKYFISACIVALVSGIIIQLGDRLIFVHLSPEIANYTSSGMPTLSYMLMCYTYGGVIEEVMMRLFLMSLITFILYKVFGKKAKEVPTYMYVVANIIAALLFAAGHLPATMITFGLTPVIIARCFILNGVPGFLFGELYRKHGIHYAMVAHAGAHVVMHIIMFII